MKYTKKILALLMSFIMLVGMLPMTVIAADEEEYEGAEIVASGECGLYVDWKLNSLGTLFLERNGSNAATYDYPYDKSSPFRNDSRIKKIVVGEGVVYLGRMVFRDLPNLTEVVLSEGLQEMEFGVFSGCALLTELELPESFNKFTTVAPFYESGIKKLTFKGNNLTTNTEPGNAWDRFFTNADIYVPLPFTLDGTVLSSYEEAAQALGHNDNKVYCVNDNATVKWKDYDGTVLETDENAAQGVIPTFDGATPSRPSDPANAYYFTGWTPEPREVTGDMVYTATYGSYGKASYLDENGEEQEVFARPLTGTETELPGGWYVVNQYITYSNNLNFTGDTKLILADGATISIDSGYTLGVNENSTLNIYCQKDKSGVLSAITMGGGSVNIYGGNINNPGFMMTEKDINIFDGNINAYYIWALKSGSKIGIFGGNVNVEYQLISRYGITLGYKNPTDSIFVHDFTDSAPAITIVDGQTFANKDNLSQHYTGTVTAADLKDKKLVPYAHNTITYARSLDGTVTGVSEADYGDEITLTVTPDEGYALNELTVTTEDNKNIEVVDNKFIMSATAVTVSATFISTKRYTVKWVVDGEVVETDENLRFGATPEYNGETPQMAPTAQYTYTFEGWSPAITPVASDVTYTAQFSITLNLYTVTWVVNGETVETDENVYYGMTPEYNGKTPTKADDEEYTYTFAGWTPEVSAVTGDATYTAQFTETPKIKPDGFNLTVEDKIHMNLYINVDDYTDPATATVTVTYNDPEKQTPTLKVDTYSGAALAALKDAADGRYVIPVLAAPAQIRDDVTVTVTDREPFTTNVATYCETIIAESNNGALVDLANAILDYGKACSAEFNYNVAAFNDKDYHYSGLNVTEYLNSKAVINTNNANGKFTGYSYIAKSVPALRIYLNATEAEVVANGLKATVNGTEVTPKVEESTGKVCVDITGILAESLDVMQTVEFNGGTLKLNALQYAKAKGGNTDFGRSMTVYNFTAYAYFGN